MTNVHVSGHKKQNTMTNYNIFKFLTSPRSSKHNYCIPSSRMEVGLTWGLPSVAKTIESSSEANPVLQVINLNKDSNCKKKCKNKKLYSSVVGTESSSTRKKCRRETKSKEGGSLMYSLQEAIGLPSKVPAAYQIKPKRCKKKPSGESCPKNKALLSNKSKKSCRKSDIVSKTHLKSKSIVTGIKSIRPACMYP